MDQPRWSTVRTGNTPELTQRILDLGPLLWHWENSGTDPSIELDLEQVKALIEEIGFEILVRNPLFTLPQMVGQLHGLLTTDYWTV